MPFKSEAQRRWMHANHPEMAERWEKATPKGAKLPSRVVPIKSKARRAGHVELRAKQRSKITPDEIARLRAELKKRRLRKGETYHHTWPGRGHAIIGDVGKKSPLHVIKTIYGPSAIPPGRRLEKTAIIATSILIARTIAKRRAAKAADEVLRKKILSHYVAGVPYKGPMPKFKGWSSKAKMDDAADLATLTDRTTPGYLGMRAARKAHPESIAGGVKAGFAPETVADAAYLATVPGGAVSMPLFKAFRQGTASRHAKTRMGKAVEKSEINLMADQIRKAKGLAPTPRPNLTAAQAITAQRAVESATRRAIPQIKAASVIENARFAKQAALKRKIQAARSRQDHRYVKMMQSFA